MTVYPSSQCSGGDAELGQAAPGRGGRAMARVILHIGPHKTGTTLLQQRFVALREPLGAAGIVSPER